MVRKISSVLSVFLFIIALSSATFASEKIKYYSTTTGLMYFRVTEVIYNNSILMDSGDRKMPTKGNTFAQIMINFANLTDKPVGNYGLNPVDLPISPSQLYLVGQSGKYYSGMNATKFLRKEVKPFTKKRSLKAGEDIVVAMAFHVPKNDRIAGVVYKFDGGMMLSINYSDPSQLQKQ
ncbi:MAG: hypothetical protein MJ234_06155 [bacterium]|nr:hypothetical protein [bacterium]